MQIILISSLVLNVGLLVLSLRLYKKHKTKPPKDSLELEDFLADLMNGGGLIRVQRINPSDVLLRSRRS